MSIPSSEKGFCTKREKKVPRIPFGIPGTFTATATPFILLFPPSPAPL